MNEITRIHLAKTPYNIEVDAKKALSRYLKTLEAYGSDKELLNDIELRMIELLSERNVKADGTISADDVKAIQEQLGDPEEFAAEGDIAIGNPMAGTDGETKPSRRLYRDMGSAVFGGVASGVARFFGVSPIWVRLAFIILTIVSFGTGILVYILLWLVVPVAKTAAERLQLEGKPVTVAAIRELNETEGPVSTKRDTKVARVVTIILGVFAALGAAGILAGCIGILFGFSGAGGVVDSINASYMGIAGYWIVGLGLACAILLAALLIIAAYALFSLKLTRTIIISSIVVIMLGLTSFATAVTLGTREQANFQQLIESKVSVTNLSLPGNFGGVNTLNLDSRNASVKYIADGSAPRIETRSLPGGDRPTISIDNETTATIRVDGSKAAYKDHRRPVEVTIYGPKLSTINVRNGYITYDGNAGETPELNITLARESSVSLDSLTIKKLTAKLAQSANLSADRVSVSEAIIDNQSDSMVRLGNIESLTVTQPDVCSQDYDDPATVTVGSVKNPTITYNGKQQQAIPSSGPCGGINIQNKEGIRDRRY